MPVRKSKTVASKNRKKTTKKTTVNSRKSRETAAHKKAVASGNYEEIVFSNPSMIFHVTHTRTKNGDFSKVAIYVLDEGLLEYLRNETDSELLYTSRVTFELPDMLDHYYTALDYLELSPNKSLEAALKFFNDTYCKDIFAKLEMMNKEKVISFDMIPFAFKKNDSVMWKDNGQIAAGRLVKTRIYQSFFGSQFIMTIEIVDGNQDGFRKQNISRTIHQFQNVMKLDRLPVQKLTDPMKKKFEERGKFYSTILKKASYLQYTGNMMAVSDWWPVSYRADGRVMIDPLSYAKMNPNHSGESDEVDSDSLMREIPESLLFATPAWIKGFSFSTKKWGKFAIENLSSISFRTNAFDYLVLDQDVKDQVRALVENSTGNFEDIISGKGGGCIMLLHGKPGGGKTLTAESVAELLQRPLYSVAVGELGTDPKALEESLRQILELSSVWNAVLLLDEADIFLEARTKHDVNRNAMVGIFLRLLEYHNGVLFLTTNRVGEFDEAFLSRISVGIHYPEHAESARMSIWTNLFKAADIKNIDPTELAHYSLNGRQIKNTVRLAMAMARSKSVPVAAEHLIRVAEQTTAFVDSVHKEQYNASSSVVSEPVITSVRRARRA